MDRTEPPGATRARFALERPPGGPPPPRPGAATSIPLPANLLAGVQRLANTNNTTVPSVIAAAWRILLWLVTGDGRVDGDASFTTVAARSGVGPRQDDTPDVLLSCQAVPERAASHGAPPQAATLVLNDPMNRLLPDYAEHLLCQFHTLLDGLVRNPDQPIRQATLITPDEAARLRDLAYGTRTTARADILAHQLFEAQVRRTPEAVAVRADGGTLTYAQLDREADGLAAVMRAAGVSPEQRVAIVLEHGTALVVALLAVLKAGGAYVPIEPAQPPGRIQAILRRAGCRLILTTSTSRAQLPDSGTTRIELDLPLPVSTNAAPAGPRPVPDNAAYVVFTSGSTGVPKGVVVTHRGLCNYLLWSRDHYVDGGAGAAVHSSIGFDLTVTSVFVPLLAGLAVHIDRSLRDVEQFVHLLGRAPDLTLLKMTPSHLRLLADTLDGTGLAGSSRTLVIGGEALTAEILRPWHQHARQIRVFNEYGPTEAVVGCCVYEVPPGELVAGDIPIGRPITNAEIHVLDERLRPVPVGVPGEIYTGGDAIAAGYLDSPADTADRFVPHPFARAPGERLFRSGDLACRRPDGNLVYLGRRDTQVKIRGYRVELGEIEACLRSASGVRAAVVVQAADPARTLTAFVVGEDAVAWDDDRLRSVLARSLPDHMLPARYRALDTLPLTGNGKLDRAGLAVMAARHYAEPPGGDAPDVLNESARIFLAAVASVLNLDAVSPTDNFLALGGDSITAMHISATCQRAGVRVRGPAILAADTLHETAAVTTDRVRQRHPGAPTA